MLIGWYRLSLLSTITYVCSTPGSDDTVINQSAHILDFGLLLFRRILVFLQIQSVLQILIGLVWMASEIPATG